jgi:(1->4)-alpha-D-glucan 1-alpha-D-glucosylmutase
VDDFHAANLERARRFPRHLLATSTHDTKRSGDVRARLAALSWIPDEWRALAERLPRPRAVDANDAYLAWQTLAGTWPIERERLDGYLEKAMREGKRTSSWLDPDEDYERRLQEYAWSLREQIVPFAERLDALGREIALAQTLLKLTCPGVPDLYQGDELWNLSLVDPDNRRPVDWDRRARLLAALEAGGAPTAETAKLFLIREALALRERHPDVFAEGPYEPLDAGPDVCAFSRGGEIVVAVPVRAEATFEPPPGYRNVVEKAGRGVWLLERR